MSKEKQIEEMAKCCPFLKNGKCQGDEPIDSDCDLMCKMFGFITNLIQEGYRKQSEGKWIVSGMFDDFLKCSSCGYQQPWHTAIEYKYCPNCGSKMKGGAE